MKKGGMGKMMRAFRSLAEYHRREIRLDENDASRTTLYASVPSDASNEDHVVLSG